MSTRIPIYLAETEVGPGLPTQRTYAHSGTGKPIGFIVLPDGMTVLCAPGGIAFRQEIPGRIAKQSIASLDSLRSVQAAIAGEYGLCWEAAEL